MNKLRIGVDLVHRVNGVRWRNGWPMQGRTDYPLVIYRQLKLKDFVNEL